MSAELVRADHPWRVALLAGMASYLDAGALVAAGVALSTSYADELRLDSGTVGALLGVQTLSFAAGALCGGRLGDLVGRRRVLTASLVLYAAGVAALVLATGPAVLLLGLLASGLAIGADLPVSLALIAEEAPLGRKGRLVAFSQVLWSAGIVVTALLAVVLAQVGVPVGRWLFAHLLVVALVVLALRLALRESLEWSTARRAADQPRPAATIRFTDLRQLFRPPVLAAVAATGVYYATWNLGANTLGQFGPLLWVQVAGGSPDTASLLSLVGVPLALVGTLVFLRVVDTPTRPRWVSVGALLTVAAWLAPVALGPTPLALVLLAVLFGAGAAMSGEVVYKVWAQELVPTLLRSTAQGVTVALARVLAGLLAFATPALALHRPRTLFALLLGLAVVAAIVGLRVVPRLATARELEAPLVVVRGSEQEQRP